MSMQTCAQSAFASLSSALSISIGNALCLPIAGVMGRSLLALVLLLSTVRRQVTALQNRVAANAAALADKAAAKAGPEAKRDNGKARMKRKHALNATMSEAEIEAVVQGRGAASSEKEVQVKADVEKSKLKRKRQWSAEKKGKKAS